MNDEIWQRIKDIYSAAIELSPEEAVRFIENSCQDDETVRREALQMLRAAAHPHFLDRPAIWASWPGAIAPSPKLSPGTIIGKRFRIEEMIAQGGMGNVYRATDVELNRTVALKTVRPSTFSTDQFLVQLRQEAQVISKLTHPGICTLHDAGRHQGLDYLVMEFLDGETLGGRMSRKQLTLAESIRVALDLLTALDYAHRRGIIHRDLKPNNVMLTKSGTKLLDFGIAKHWQNDADTLIAGTPAYMAPEQLRDGVSDIRTDIYSFGILFCSLLSPPGTAPVDVVSVIDGIPPSFRQIVSKCLADDPADRWQDAGDLRFAIQTASLQPLEAESLNKRSTRFVAVAVAVMVMLAVVAGGLWFGRKGSEGVPASRIEFEILPPDGHKFAPIERGGPPVVSPDGTMVVFVAQNQTGSNLWLRKIDSAVASVLPGTDGAAHPFWSPDSKQVGFFARNSLLTIELGSNSPKQVCVAGEGRGAAWSPQGVIVFSPGYTDPLFRVPATGGNPIPITKLDTANEENSHRWPSFLPDGKRVLFVLRSNNRQRQGLYSVSIDGGVPQRIADIESSAVFAPTDKSNGYLLYVHEARIVAKPFRTDDLTFTGSPAVIGDLGATDESTNRAPISVSETGVLAYGGGQLSKSRVVWYDSSGKELTDRQQVYPWRTRFLRLSPDNRTLALEKLDLRFGTGSIWLHDLQHSTRPLTIDPISAFSPVWSPNGQNVAYAVDRGETFELMTTSVNGALSKVLFSSKMLVAPTDWTPDGFLVYEVQDPRQGWIVGRVSVGDPFQTVTPDTSPHERFARLSPNRHWLAYTSTKTGNEEVYIRPTAQADREIQISAVGGSEPVWGAGPGDLLFVDNDRMLVRYQINLTSRRVEASKPLLRLPPIQSPGRAAGWEYDVTSDGKSIVVTLPDSQQETRPITVVTGWQQRVR
jgi:serine/threonine protein kinase